jgi:pimeloyl-ACP methyl ester carboxylesterase
MISMRKANGADGVGPVRYLAYDTPGGPPRVMTDKRWLAEIILGFPQALPEPDKRLTRSGDVLFFVHGFNVSQASALQSQFDTADRLSKAGWKGRVISFDWPSDGLVFAYLPDRSNARAAASALVTAGIALLETAQKQDCTINVHVMAHSMGAFVTQQAFNWAYQDVPPSWKVAQVLFVAGDVDASVFSQDNPTAKVFSKYAGRFTAYCSRYDKALAVSNAKRLEMAPRLGRVGLPEDAPPAMCEVDCGDLFANDYPDAGEQLDPNLTHCFYFRRNEFWRDAALTLAGGLDRSAIPTRDHTLAADRFILDPNGISMDDYRKALAMAAVTPSTQPGQIDPDA